MRLTRQLALALLAAIGVVGLSGCQAGSAAPNASAKGDAAGPAVVKVERSDLTSILALNGSVQATPSFVVVAPVAGLVHFSEGAGAGDQTVGASIASVDGKAVKLPHAGKVIRKLVDDGQRVDAGIPLVEVRYAGFGVPVRVPADQAYRMYSEPVAGIVNVEAGPSGVKCVLVPVPDGPSAAGEETVSGNEPSAGGSVDSGAVEQTYTSVTCLIPEGTKVFAGLSVRIGLETGKVKGALSLPISAVSGSLTKGRVRVPADASNRNGSAKVREVELGISDGTRIEIKSGLKDGESVYARPPSVSE